MNRPTLAVVSADESCVMVQRNDMIAPLPVEWWKLRAAACQEDPELAGIYRRVLEDARELCPQVRRAHVWHDPCDHERGICEPMHETRLYDADEWAEHCRQTAAQRRLHAEIEAAKRSL